MPSCVYVAIECIDMLQVFKEFHRFGNSFVFFQWLQHLQRYHKILALLRSSCFSNPGIINPTARTIVTDVSDGEVMPIKCLRDSRS
jgi:hypothetical protein